VLRHEGALRLRPGRPSESLEAPPATPSVRRWPPRPGSRPSEAARWEHKRDFAIKRRRVGDALRCGSRMSPSISGGGAPVCGTLAACACAAGIAKPR
jgi:hypothetical protein